MALAKVKKLTASALAFCLLLLAPATGWRRAVKRFGIAAAVLGAWAAIALYVRGDFSLSDAFFIGAVAVLAGWSAGVMVRSFTRDWVGPGVALFAAIAVLGGMIAEAKLLPSERLSDFYEGSFGILIAIGVFGNLYTGRQQDKQWQRFAVAHGWSYRKKDKGIRPKDWEGPPLNVWRHGEGAHSPQCLGVVEGKLADTEVRIFRLFWIEGWTGDEDATPHSFGPILMTTIPAPLEFSIAVKPSEAAVELTPLPSEKQVLHAQASALGFDVYVSDPTGAALIDEELIGNLRAFPALRYGVWRLERDALFVWDWPQYENWIDCLGLLTRSVRRAVDRFERSRLTTSR